MNTKTDSGIETINEFVEWTQNLKGGLLLYRGLSNSEWELEASGYRRIKPPKGDVPSLVFQNYIRQLLSSAGLQGFRHRHGKDLHDLELLAELQHNGAATCLIDFTTNPLIALWFACRGNSGENGKVCAMPTDKPENFGEVTYKKLKESKIKEFFAEGKLWKWTPPGNQNNRITAQSSVFVFGKGKIEKNDHETIEIKWKNKKSILKELESKFGINESHLFSDFTGFSLANAHDKPYSDYSADDYFYLGISSHQRSEYEKAIENYDEAIEIKPRYAEAYDSRGAAKGQSGDLQGAIEDFSKAIEINPRLAGAYYNRGIAKGQLDDHRDAIADYSKAIEINPRYVEAYDSRGAAKGQSGDLQGAIEDFSKAIEINPQDAVAYSNRGYAKTILDDLQGAIEDCNKAIEINHRFAEAYDNRGHAKETLGDHQGAIADFDKAIEINHRFAEAYCDRGIAKGQSGDRQGAIEDFDNAIRINPQYAEAYYNRGNAKDSLGDHQGAQEDWNRAAELDPKFKKPDKQKK